jgi:mannitol-specific phosphotransferase system IIBC component
MDAAASVMGVIVALVGSLAASFLVYLNHLDSKTERELEKLHQWEIDMLQLAKTNPRKAEEELSKSIQEEVRRAKDAEKIIRSLNFGSDQSASRETFEERRESFEQKNKDDWDYYHDPSRYIR